MRERNEKKIEVCAKSVKDVKDLLYFMSTNKLKNTLIIKLIEGCDRAINVYFVIYKYIEYNFHTKTFIIVFLINK